MHLNFEFFLTSILLGAGLAMDAFSVSVVDGLNETHMKKGKMLMIAAIFAVFQFAMPAIGWVCVTTVASLFEAFSRFIPWIAFALLAYIGGKMLYDGISNKEECECCKCAVTFSALLVQGVATSIDALSVGFTIAEYDLLSAVLSALLIAGVTFFICAAGILIGRKAGTKLAGKAGILGGAILIFIGLEIFITSFF